MPQAIRSAVRRFGDSRVDEMVFCHSGNRPCSSRLTAPSALITVLTSSCGCMGGGRFVRVSGVDVRPDAEHRRGAATVATDDVDERIQVAANLDVDEAVISAPNCMHLAAITQPWIRSPAKETQT